MNMVEQLVPISIYHLGFQTHVIYLSYAFVFLFWVAINLESDSYILTSNKFDVYFLFIDQFIPRSTIFFAFPFFPLLFKSFNS